MVCNETVFRAAVTETPEVASQLISWGVPAGEVLNLIDEKENLTYAECDEKANGAPKEREPIPNFVPAVEYVVARHVVRP